MIKLVLINHYQDFLIWCDKHNSSLFAFEKTVQNQRDFCKFIEKFYKSQSLLDGINNTHYFNNEYFLNKKKNVKKKNKDKTDFLVSNLRMTIFEVEYF